MIFLLVKVDIIKPNNLELNNEKFQVIRFNVGYNYMETMGFNLQAGRFFTEGRESDNRETVVVNESFASARTFAENPDRWAIGLNGKEASQILILQEMQGVWFLGGTILQKKGSFQYHATILLWSRY